MYVALLQTTGRFAQACYNSHVVLKDNSVFIVLICDHSYNNVCFFSAVPPSPPTIGTVMTLSSSSITVEWSAPTNDGGSPLTGYTVEARPQTSSDAVITVSIVSDVTEAVVSGLTPFVTYDVQVRAMNAIGSSQPSQTLSPVTHPAGESSLHRL